MRRKRKISLGNGQYLRLSNGEIERLGVSSLTLVGSGLTIERVGYWVRVSDGRGNFVTSEFCPPRPKSVIIAPPGRRLWQLAEFLCTKKTYNSIFCPLMAEFHHEYFEALNEGRSWRARWVRVLYFGAFFKSAGLNVSMKFLREAWERFQKKA